MGSDNKESRKIQPIMNTEQLLPATLSFTGSLSGVFLGFQLDRWWEARSNKSRALEFLRLVKKELDDNRKTLSYLADSLKKGDFEAPFFAIRFVSWQTFLHRLPLVREDIRTEMMTIYYEMETHDRTVSLYRGLVYASYAQPAIRKSEPLNQQIIQHRKALLNQIGDDKGGLLHSIPGVIEKIDVEIKNLLDC